MASGLITRFLGEGLAASRPADPDVGSAIAFYWSTDTNEMSAWLENAWVEDVFGTGGALLAANNLSDLANAATARTNLGVPLSTAGEYRDDTQDKVLTGEIVWDAAEPVALTPGTNVSLDLSTGINFSLAMGGNYTLDNPTNAKPGQSGFIKITQDGTGSRTLAFGTNYLWDGGTDGVLSTAASSKDVLYYQVLSSTEIHCSLRKAIA